MSDTAATIDVVPPVGGRSFPNAQARQHARHFARTIGGNVLRGVGAVAALGALIVTVTVAAAWIVNSALVTKPEMQASGAGGADAGQRRAAFDQDRRYQLRIQMGARLDRRHAADGGADHG
jgi:hypothetical protein